MLTDFQNSLLLDSATNLLPHPKTAIAAGDDDVVVYSRLGLVVAIMRFISTEFSRSEREDPSHCTVSVTSSPVNTMDIISRVRRCLLQSLQLQSACAVDLSVYC